MGNILLHGGGKPFDLTDPVDQIIIACLCVFLLCFVAMLFVAAREVKRERYQRDKLDDVGAGERQRQ